MEKSEKLWSRNFVLIIVINFLVFMNHIMLLSTFPFYIESLGGSEALAGLAATLFSFVAVLCRPFVGWMLDNGKRRSTAERRHVDGHPEWNQRNQWFWWFRR